MSLGLLDPEHQRTIADAFLAMRGSEPEQINNVLLRLEDFIQSGRPGSPDSAWPLPLPRTDGGGP